MTLPRRAGCTNIPARMFVAFTRVRFCRFLLSSLLLLCMAGLVPRLLAQTAHFTSFSSVIPPVQTTVASGISGARGVAVDGSGNVMIGILNCCDYAVRVWAPNGDGSYTDVTATQYFQIAFPRIPANNPFTTGAVAVDSHNIFYFENALNLLEQVFPTIVIGGNLVHGGAIDLSFDSGGPSNPYGVAVDGAGNIYFADTSNNRVLIEQPSGNTYVETALPFSGLNAPSGIAVDTNGNVYIADTGNNRVLKETFNGIGSFNPAYPNYEWYTESTIGIGLNAPSGVALDGKGNVYITDTGNNRVLMEILAFGRYVQSTLPFTGLSQPVGVALDSQANIYIADAGNGRVLKLAAGPGPDFGSVPVGSESSAVELTFTLDSAGSIAAPAVVMQGAPNLDFTDAGTGTCTASHSYVQGDTCTVDVLFKPRYAGARNGAVNLLDSSGNVIATEYIFGTGVAPQIAFMPSAQSSLYLSYLGSSLLPGEPKDVALDGNGNLYIAGDKGVVKETPSGANPTSIGNGLLNPSGVAVDGGGNVYIADSENFRVLKETPSAGGYTQSTVVDNLPIPPTGVAVDGSGNVYIVYSANNHFTVLKETPSAVGYTTNIVADNTGYGYAVRVAVDGNGKVYLTDSYNQCVRIETPSGNIYADTRITPTIDDGSGNPIGFIPTAVAVDAGGNIYIAVTGNGNILLMEAPSAGGYTQSIISYGFPGSPGGMALDGSGNIYIADVGFPIRLLAFNRTMPPSMSFAATNIGSQSSDSPQSVSFTNIGNADLLFPVPPSGFNPVVPSGFTVSGSANCPVSASIVASPVLAAGSVCTYDINFVPTVGGPNSDSLILTDNNLNVSNATQSIGLSGTGTGTAPSITSSPVSQTVNAGSSTPVILTAAASGIPAPTVQWWFSTNNGSTFAPVVGATSNMLSFVATASMNSYQYEAVFTNTFGTATTSVAALTVDTLPTVTINPTNQGAPAGSSAIFTAAASGNPSPAVQWQVSANGGGFINIPNATSTTLIVTGVTDSMSGNQYRAVFTNLVGAATTSAGTLTVGDYTIAATPPSQTIPAGHSATYTINVAAVGGLAGNVAVTCSGGPPKSTCTVAPGSVMLNGKASAAVTLAPGKNVGTFTLTFGGSLAGIKHSANVTLTIK